MGSFRNWQIYELAILFLFFSEHTWVLSVLFLCFLDILPTYHGFLRVFLFSFAGVFSVFSSSFMPFSYYSLFPFLCVLSSDSWGGDQVTYLMPFGCQLLHRQLIFVDCSPELCSWGQGAGCIARYTAWLQNVRGMGRAVSRQICVAAARTVTSVRGHSTHGCPDFCSFGVSVVYLLQQFCWREWSLILVEAWILEPRR